MGVFVKKYSILSNRDYSETTKIFRDNLDDMTKNGYSFGGNTVIYNSDHKSKYFSGEYKTDRFVVRQTDSSTDDFYYKLLPKHEISFESLDENRTKVNVKSTSTFGLIMFFLFLIITLFVFSILYISVFLDEGNRLFMLFSLIPLGAMLITSVIANHSINDTKETLKYIYKQ